MKGFPFFLLAMLTAYTMVGYTFGRYLLSMLAPDMIDDGVISYQGLAIMTALSQFGFLFISLFSGQLTRLIGPKTLILGSVSLTGLGLVLLSFVRAEWLIVIIIGLLGVLTASGWVPVVRVIQEGIKEKYWGLSIAQAGSGTAYGIVATGFFVPIIMASHDWDRAWLYFGIAALVMAFGGIFKMPSVPRDRKEADGAGGSAVSQIRRFHSYFLMMFLSGGAAMAYLTYIVPYLRDDLGMSPAYSGMVWSLLGFIGMGSGLVWGRVADHFSQRTALLYGHVMLVVGYGLIPLWGSPTVALISAVIYGASFFGVMPLFGSYASKVVSSNEVVSLYGKGNFCLGLGGTVFNFVGGNIKSFTGAFDLMFALAALAALAALCLCTRLPDARTVSAEAAETTVSVGGQPASGARAYATSGSSSEV
jgi:MFS family permease